MSRMNTSLAVVLLLIAAPALGQSITDVTGTFTAGETITIAGSSFGTKSPAAPLKWETWESGSDGGLIVTNQPEWVDNDENGATGASYSDTRAHSGSISAFNTNQPWTGNFSSRTNHYITPLSDELFVSYWFYYDGGTTTDNGMNIKLTRINSYSASGQSYGGLGLTTFNNLDFVSGASSYGEISSTFVNGEGSHNVNTGPPNYRDYLCDAQPNMWTRFDAYKLLSTPGVEDGRVFLYNVESQSYELDNAEDTRAAGDTFQLDCIKLGLMWGNQDEDFVEISLYMDDIYIDNTLARVEIGNNADFRSCTHREMQIPSAWSATEIAVTVNTGTFTNGATAYLFVVDSDGTASTGYPVIINSSIEEPGEMVGPSNIRVE